MLNYYYNYSIYLIIFIIIIIIIQLMNLKGLHYKIGTSFVTTFIRVLYDVERALLLY